MRQNAEDDYSELLHLERVLIMRDGGDFIPSLQTPIIPANIATPFEKSPPRFTRTSSSGDTGRLSDGGSNKSKSARISKGIIENKVHLKWLFCLPPRKPIYLNFCDRKPVHSQY